MRADIFRRLGGMNAHPPQICGLLQTDGSFNYYTKHSRVAMVLKTELRGYTLTNIETIPNTHGSRETKWAAINRGLLFALENNQRNIHIESDNLSIIRALMLGNNVLKDEYAKYYRYIIMATVSKTWWTDIRWIPRELNASEQLFRNNNYQQLR